jgi:hypothetical protein
MDWGALIVVGAIAWTVCAVGLGLLIGGVIRHRETQVPREAAETPGPESRRAA